MRHGNSALFTLFVCSSSLSCAPEATAPESGAAVSRVVPIAIPDVWCSATDTAADTVPAQYRCHTTREAPPPPRASTKQDSTSHTLQISPVVSDSAKPPADTTRP
jgi:hypothetical protein